MDRHKVWPEDVIVLVDQLDRRVKPAIIVRASTYSSGSGESVTELRLSVGQGRALVAELLGQIEAIAKEAAND